VLKKYFGTRNVCHMSHDDGKQIPQKWWTDIEVENNNTHVQNLARKCPRSYLDYFMEQIWLLYDAC
jgi:hypothetical protein